MTAQSDDHTQASRDHNPAPQAGCAKEGINNPYADTFCPFCGAAEPDWNGSRADPEWHKQDSSPPPPAAEGGWQEIETAPKDTFVDIWVAPYSKGQVFLDRGQRACRFRLVEGDWRNAQGGRVESNGNNNGQPYGLRVTHWRPLPAPPHIAEQQTP